MALMDSARSDNRSPNSREGDDDPYAGFNDFDHAYDLEVKVRLFVNLIKIMKFD